YIATTLAFHPFNCSSNGTALLSSLLHPSYGIIKTSGDIQYGNDFTIFHNRELIVQGDNYGPEICHYEGKRRDGLGTARFSLLFTWLLSTLSYDILPRVVHYVREEIHKFLHMQMNAKFRQLHSELKSITKGDHTTGSGPVSNRDHLEIVIEGLPEEYSSLVATIQNCAECDILEVEPMLHWHDQNWRNSRRPLLLNLSQLMLRKSLPIKISTHKIKHKNRPMIYSSLVVHAEATMVVLVTRKAAEVTPVVIPQFNIRSVTKAGTLSVCVDTEMQIFINLPGLGLTHGQLGGYNKPPTWLGKTLSAVHWELGQFLSMAQSINRSYRPKHPFLCPTLKILLKSIVTDFRRQPQAYIANSNISDSHRQSGYWFTSEIIANVLPILLRNEFNHPSKQYIKANNNNDITVGMKLTLDHLLKSFYG
ncbi:hypothetical protein CR513_22385, partial [Mucuna pruriens]